MALSVTTQNLAVDIDYSEIGERIVALEALVGELESELSSVRSEIDGVLQSEIDVPLPAVYLEKPAENVASGSSVQVTFSSSELASVGVDDVAEWMVVGISERAGDYERTVFDNTGDSSQMTARPYASVDLSNNSIRCEARNFTSNAETVTVRIVLVKTGFGSNTELSATASIPEAEDDVPVQPDVPDGTVPLQYSDDIAGLVYVTKNGGSVRVHSDGAVERESYDVFSEGHEIGYVPDGYRPLSAVSFECDGCDENGNVVASGAVEMSIGTDGLLSVTGVPSGRSVYALDGIDVSYSVRVVVS